MNEILTTARDLELEVNENDIEELIMGHEDELTIEELQEILNEEHQETQRNVSPSEQEEDERGPMPTSAIKDILKKWKAVSDDIQIKITRSSQASYNTSSVSRVRVLVPLETRRFEGLMSVVKSVQAHSSPIGMVAAVAEWYRYRILACLVTSSSPVPLKIRREGQ
ncbi:uncharacterized protein TNCV_2364391 [Trichonephila clavipes]|nr:uncharacterized protein TNCV_2364391 [Trichonephila clavipes]